MKSKNMFTVKNRAKQLQEVMQETYDLAIIGGGITGAGIALDAASRGMKTILLEKNDFASGTSSKSTKLIHGGLRYLKQLEISLVRVTGTERAVLHRLAPHLVRPEKMLLPLIQGGTYGKLASSFGLWVYDFLAGVKKEDRRLMLSKEEAIIAEPLLDEHILTGGGLYAEYRTDDARLTIELLKRASSYGSVSMNYFNVDNFHKPDQLIEGVIGTDLITNQSITVKAHQVVSATGPWVDHFRKKNQSMNDKTLHLTKGVHIVVDRTKFPLKQSAYFDVPDGRMIFAIPRGKTTYIGTTDTNYKGDLNQIRTTKQDAQYLIDSVNSYFPVIQLEMTDIKSSWAGLRPLIHQNGKDPSEISRKDEIFQSKDGLISIAGGKLTGYRKMAQKIVDLVASKKIIHRELKTCQTKFIGLTERIFSNFDEVQQYTHQMANRLSDFSEPYLLAEYLVSNYGYSIEDIIKNYEDKTEEKDFEKRIILSELDFCIQNEAIAHSTDFLVRRTGRLFFDIDSVIQYKNLINQYLTKEFNWSEVQQNKDLSSIDQAIQNATSFKSNEPKRKNEIEVH